MKPSIPPADFRLPTFPLLPMGQRLMLLALLGLAACNRTTPVRLTTQPSEDHSPAPTPATETAPSLPDFAVDAVESHEGEAFWYDVPAQSLPQRRAWTGELTAASDTLPLNSYARVRRLDGQDSDKKVIVRITDSGIHHKGGLIDVNRDAAEALGIVKLGQVKVRVETLALQNATTDKPVDKKDAPAAPKASEINGKPAAGPQAEKDAANAKTGGQSTR